MLTFKVDSSLQRIVWRNLWMTPPSNDGALGLSPKWGSARVSSLNFSRNKFKLGVAMGTVINRQDFLPITHSGITWFGLVTWKEKRKILSGTSSKCAKNNSSNYLFGSKSLFFWHDSFDNPNLSNVQYIDPAWPYTDSVQGLVRQNLKNIGFQYHNGLKSILEKH